MLTPGSDPNLLQPVDEPVLEARVTQGAGRLARAARVLLVLLAAGLCVQFGRTLPARDVQVHVSDPAAASADLVASAVPASASDPRDRPAAMRASTTESVVYGEISRAHLARMVKNCAEQADLAR